MSPLQIAGRQQRVPGSNVHQIKRQQGLLKRGLAGTNQGNDPPLQAPDIINVQRPRVQEFSYCAAERKLRQIGGQIVSRELLRRSPDWRQNMGLKQSCARAEV